MKLINSFLLSLLVLSLISQGVLSSSSNAVILTNNNFVDENLQVYDPDELIQKYPELPEFRTANGNAYMTQEDTITYLLDICNVNYKDDEGLYRPIDNSIVPLEEAITGAKTGINEFSYKNKENSLNYYFGYRDSKPLIRVEQNGAYADISFNSKKLTDMHLVKDVDSRISNKELSSFLQRNPSIMYQDSISGKMDITYTIASNGLKEMVFLYEYPEEETYIFGITTDNCTVDTKEGNGIVILDAKGAELFHLGSFLLIDREGNHSESLKTEIQKKNDFSCEIRVCLDREFLEKAQYPIIMDPTVQGEDVVFDTYTSSENPDYHYYLWDYLRTGKDEPYGVRRSYVKFALPSIASTNPVMTGNIYLKPYDSEGVISLNACRITSSWSSDSVTWNNSPSVNTSPTLTSSISGTWITIPITSFVRRWNVGIYGNNGIRIKGNNESNINVWATFYSSDYSTQSYGPKLEITVYTGTNQYQSYSGGMPSRTFSIKNNLSSTHSAYLTTARSLWNSSGAGCAISASSSSSNTIAEDSTLEANGLYIPNNGTFSILINFDSIYNEGVEWSNRYVGTIVHELGHALSLNDLENGQWCIMGYKRDRNVIYKPTASDINGVINQY